MFYLNLLLPQTIKECREGIQSAFLFAKDEVFSKKHGFVKGLIFGIALLFAFKPMLSSFLQTYQSEADQLSSAEDQTYQFNPLIFMDDKYRAPNELIVVTPGFLIDRDPEGDRLSRLNTFAPEATYRAIPVEQMGNAYEKMLELIEASAKENTLDLLVISAHGQDLLISPSCPLHNDCASLRQLFDDLKKMSERLHKKVAQRIVLDSCETMHSFAHEDVEMMQQAARQLDAEISGSVTSVYAHYHYSLNKNLMGGYIIGRFISFYPDGSIAYSPWYKEHPEDLAYLEETFGDAKSRTGFSFPPQTPEAAAEDQWDRCYAGNSTEMAESCSRSIMERTTEENREYAAALAALACVFISDDEQRHYCIYNKLRYSPFINSWRPSTSDQETAERIIRANELALMALELPGMGNLTVPTGPEYVTQEMAEQNRQKASLSPRVFSNPEERQYDIAAPANDPLVPRFMKWLFHKKTPTSCSY